MVSEIGQEALEEREKQNEVHDIFVQRWSPRAMSSEPVPEEEIDSLFEAARWAPSSYNNQHWRFVYVERTDEEWDAFLDLLADPNRQWAKRAGILVVMCSKTTFDHNGEPAPTHSFDTGAAWENMALQGAEMNLVVHGMQGFDYKGMAELIDLDEGFEIEAMAAIGKPASEDVLSEDFSDREEVSGRKEVSEIVSKAEFDF